MTKQPHRIASIIYWKSQQEREEAQAKAEEADETISSLGRKLFRKYTPPKQ